MLPPRNMPIAMNIVLLSAVTLACITYMGCFVCRGVPESISATYYMLGKRGWMFQAVMILVGFLLCPVWIPVSKDQHSFLAFLSCASLMFVGAAPAFRMELEGRVHYVSAAVCCACAVLWQVLDGLWDVTVFFAWSGGMLSLVWRKQWCWWMECAVMGSLLANLWRIV